MPPRKREERAKVWTFGAHDREERGKVWTFGAHDREERGKIWTFGARDREERGMVETMRAHEREERGMVGAFEQDAKPPRGRRAEHALIAATLRVRVGYRFTRAFALYLEGAALLTHNTYTIRPMAFDPPEPPDPRRAYSAAPVASIAVAVRPVSWLELSVAPALGVHGTALFGARGHVAVPLRLTSWRFTLAPTVELIGLTGSEWKQLALTGGLGVDW